MNIKGSIPRFGIMAAAMLLSVLLLGCGAAQSSPDIPPPRLSPTKQTENDDLRCYPLDTANCRFLAFGTDLLLLRPGENAALSRYAGRGLTLSAWADVPRNGVPCRGGESIGCYDPEGQTLLLFDPDLTPVDSFSLPGCADTPRLLGTKAYYCTPEALMELDTETGLRRTLRQQEGLRLCALLPEEDMAVCALDGAVKQLCIRIADGSLAAEAPPILAAAEFGNGEHAALKLGFLHCLYLGQTELVLPAGWEFLEFLPTMNAALLCSPEKELGIYDLSTGNCMASLPLAERPEAVAVTTDGRVFFQCGSRLFQWEPRIRSRRDSRISITPLYTPRQPDEKGLAQCRQRGAYLENQYGVRVLLNAEAVQVAPKGCILEPEHLRPAIAQALAGVETALGRFPSALATSAFSGTGRTYLCPVRSILVGGEARESLQFWSGRDCYIAVTASAHGEKAALEAFLPLVDRQVLMKCDAYDAWTADTPQAAEDERCSLLYQAMQPGNRELFLDAVLQNRLRTLCAGLRQTFGLSAGQTLVWEQYLWAAG